MLKIYFIIGLIFLASCASSREFRPLSAASLAPQLEQRVEFGFDSDRIGSGEGDLLDNEATLLRQHPGIKLILEGHADSVGSDLYNIELGDRRARQIAVELVKRGIDPGRLIVVSEGERRPRTTNQTEDGRRRNRRVECIIRK